MVHRTCKTNFLINTFYAEDKQHNNQGGFGGFRGIPRHRLHLRKDGYAGGSAERADSGQRLFWRDDDQG